MKSIKLICYIGVVSMLGMVFMALAFLQEMPDVQQTMEFAARIKLLFDLDKVMLSQIQTPSGVICRAIFRRKPFHSPPQRDELMEKIGQDIWTNYQTQLPIIQVKVIYEEPRGGGCTTRMDRIERQVNRPQLWLKPKHKSVTPKTQKQP